MKYEGWKNTNTKARDWANNNKDRPEQEIEGVNGVKRMKGSDERENNVVAIKKKKKKGVYWCTEKGVREGEKKASRKNVL